MNCKNCNHPLPENGGSFCSNCGTRIEMQPLKFICSVCGKNAEAEDRFCAFCGGEVKTSDETNLSAEGNEKKAGKGKLGKSYIFTVLSAIISFVIRISAQGEQRLYISSFNFRYTLGLDADWKPFYSLIPIAAGVIAALIITSDKTATSQRKTTAFLINAIYLALAFVFIWMDIPHNLFDF